jgi:hypothetical protein
MVVAGTEVAEKPGCVCCVWVWMSGWLFWCGVHVMASSCKGHLDAALLLLAGLPWLGPQPWPGDEGKSRTAKKGFPLYDSGLYSWPRNRGVPCLGTWHNTPVCLMREEASGQAAGRHKKPDTRPRESKIHRGDSKAEPALCAQSG